MSPAAAPKPKKAALEILMVANQAGETIQVAKPKASRSKPKATAEVEAGDGSEPANKVSPTKAAAAKTTKATGAKTTTKSIYQTV